MTRKMCHELYKKYVTDPDMTEQKHAYDYEEIEEYYATKIEEENRNVFSIMLGAEVIGEIQLKRIDWTVREATLSIILVNDHFKNKGYGTEAEKLILDYGFETLNLNKILADTTLRNERSKHVLKKIGFEHIEDKDEMSYFEFDRKRHLST